MTEPDSHHPEYVVVMRAQSGFHFGEIDRASILQGWPTPIGRADFLFASRYANLKGFSEPVRMGLRVEARGTAPTLIEAVESFANVANGLVAVFSFCANVECDDLQCELAFDDTPGKFEREFFQQLLPEDPVMPHSGRPMPIEAALAVAKAIGTHTETERLHRAIVHYHHALQNWKPGLETFALAHLYMGMEALTPVAWRHRVKSEALTRKDLALQWGIDWANEQQRKSFDPEVRRRLLFNGDDATYQAAKTASDAYEHSFESITKVRNLAMPLRDRTAEYLRQAILRLAEVHDTVTGVLLAPLYDVPDYWSFTYYVWGKIEGNQDQLAAPDSQYPYLKWTRKSSESKKEDGTLDVTFHLEITPKLAQGLSFRGGRLELWGTQPVTSNIPVEDMHAEASREVEK